MEGQNRPERAFSDDPDSPQERPSRRRRRRSGRSGRSSHTGRREPFSARLRSGLASGRRWFTAAAISASIVILLLLPLYSAWDYGGILPWSQWLVTAGMAVALIASIPLLLRRDNLGYRRMTFIPLLALAAWGIAALQTIPLEGEAVQRLSAGSAAAYTRWFPAGLGEVTSGAAIRLLGESNLEQVRRFPVSVCTHLTQTALIGPAMFAVACLLASLVFNSRRTLLVMLITVAVSGGLVAFLGISDQIRAPTPGIDRSLITPAAQASAPFGSFVCRNNAAGYLNLTLAASIGLLVYTFKTARDRAIGDEKYQLQPESWWDRPLLFLQNFLLQIDAATVAALLLVVLNVSGILASQSRGGSLAIVSGTLVTLLLAGSKRTRLWQPLGVLLSVGGVVILLGSIGLMERVQERLETIWSSDGQRDGRLDHWPDGLAAAWQYFPMGSGLGTYRYAYLPYQESSAGAWFVNADNMAVEWLVEGGIWLLPLVLVSIVITAYCLVRLADIRKAPHLSALVATGWFVIGSQMVSEFFDFGILLPSNYLTLAVLVGAIVGASARRYRPTSRRSLDQWNAGTRPGLLFLAVFVAVAAVGVIANRTARRHAGEEYLATEINRFGGLYPLDPAASEEALADSINPSLHSALAARLLAIQAAVGQRRLRRLDPDSKLDYASLASIEARRAAYYLNALPEDEPAESVLLPGQSLADILAARRHALAALAVCPLNDVARFQLLQTGFAAGDSEQTAEQLIEQWGHLRPRYGEALDRAARMAVIFPGPESAKPLVRQMLVVEPNRLASAWPLVELMGGEAAVEDVLPDVPQVLLQALETRNFSPELTQSLIRRTHSLLASGPGSLDEAVWAYLAARLEVVRKDYEKAEELFQLAVMADPSTTLYRYRWAEMLERIGKHDEALAQIEICVLQSPRNTQYLNKRRALTNRRRPSTS